MAVLAVTQQTLLDLAMAGTETNSSGSGFPGAHPLLGLSLGAGSLGCGVLGKQLLRLGHLRGRRGVRMIGFLMQTVGGPLLSALALLCTTQSVLVVFQGLDAVGTLLVAPCLLGEGFSRRKAVGAALVAAGTISAAVFGPKDAKQDRNFRLNQLHELLWRPSVGVWAVAFALVAMVCLRRLVTTRVSSTTASRGLACGLLTGLFNGNSWCLKLTLRLLVLEHFDFLRLCAAPLFWLTVAGAVGSALMAMIFMVRGTTEFETVFLVPVIDGSSIISAAASGFFVVKEGNNLPWPPLIGYALGVFAVLIGIWQLYADEAAKAQQSLDGPPSQELVSASEQSARDLQGPTFGDLVKRYSNRVGVRVMNWRLPFTRRP